MIPKECKRLAEVDFPIAVVSAHASREKSIRHGHPATLHLWWARRPLASCRAMLLALLLPDPCDPFCPVEFKFQARSILKQLTGVPESDDGLRRILLGFIGDVANWDVANHPLWIGVARDLIKAAHPEETPLVVDPFAGGGSIPLEAIRLGCDAFASDLNPVACLINKVLLEDIPRHGPELAEKLRKVGDRVKALAEKELAEFYPADPDGARPVAYLWARTVKCEAPHCGAEIPLVRSFWLSKKASLRLALKPIIVRPQEGLPRIEFDIFKPEKEKDVESGGTVNRAKATCPCCKAVLSQDRVRAQLIEQRGGSNVLFDGKGRRIGGARLLALVTCKEGQPTRQYRLPNERDYEAIWKAKLWLSQTISLWDAAAHQGVSPVPDEVISLDEIRRINVPIYGVTRWGDLFTDRQKVALITHIRLQQEIAGAAHEFGPVISKLADTNSTVCTWQIDPPRLRATFNRQALPMTWDFAETCPIGEGAGNYRLCIQSVVEVIERHLSTSTATVQLADACESPLPSETASLIFTDPPYYDAVPYSHLSDFFYVWLRRSLTGSMGVMFDRPLTPKDAEIVVDRPHALSNSKKDVESYQAGMARAFSEGRRILREDGIGSVVFAHKTTEGWEALLSGMIHSGWTITGSWPIATEMGSRLNARDTASLATSIHLVCRPRDKDAPVGDWGDVLRDLTIRVNNWMDRLESEGIHGADLVFACIGPALEVFSRFTRVESAEGDIITLEMFLQKVWEVVGRVALRRILGTDSPNVYGEDVRLTALFLWTYGTSRPTTSVLKRGPKDLPAETTEEEEDLEESDQRIVRRDGYSLPYDIVRRFCQPLGIHIDRWEGRLISNQKGIITLLAIERRAKHLLGGDAAQDMKQISRALDRKNVQPTLFDDLDTENLELKERASEARRKYEQATWAHLHQDTIPLLDHVHKAMLFQKQGQSNALRELLFFEMSYRPEFRRLANALSVLYPSGSEEKRLLDAMLLAMPK